MTRFFGVVGYGGQVENVPGSWIDQIVEKSYYGDVLSNGRDVGPDDKINRDISVNNSISIVADAYAYEHFFAIRYIKWSGTLWTVTNVLVQRPRLILRMGEVYNGETASTPSQA